jgi:hypothetical protein
MIKFILTSELGKLARWLRIMGYDSLYYKNDNLGTLIIQALREDRLIVTRRQTKIDDLEKKTLVLKTDKLKGQLLEVIGALHLTIDEQKMFSRCVLCNEELVLIDKGAVKELIPLYVYKTQNYFRQCALCKRVYWQGSHWGNVKETIQKIYADERQ